MPKPTRPASKLGPSDESFPASCREAPTLREASEDSLHSMPVVDARPASSLFEALYRELRWLARAQRRRWVGNPTLNTTALIHEAYLKLAKQGPYTDSNHFLATVARVMRHVLVNYAEQRRAAKRGGGQLTVELDPSSHPVDAIAEDVLALHDALERLKDENERRCRVIECRVFGGMTVEETAEVLSVSPATIKRDWALATAWLYRELGSVECGAPTR